MPEITSEEIDNYIDRVRKAVHRGQYRIHLNSNRPDNRALFEEYLLDEAGAGRILMDLEPQDFCQKLRNEHIGYEHEELYVFSKEVVLLPRFGDGEQSVRLYIKLNLIPDRFLVVISFHEQRHPMKKYAFDR